MDYEILHEVLMDMLGLLFAQRVNYQTVHWQVKGKAYYGDHLLFQRLYEEDLPDQIDQIGEKLVGILEGEEGAHPIDNLEVCQRMHRWLESWSAYPCPFRRSLQSEHDLQAYWKRAYDLLKEIDSLTLGLDDWIMSTASAHETNVYLLQQRCAEHEHVRQASQQLTRAWFTVPSFGRSREAADDTESD